MSALTVQQPVDYLAGVLRGDAWLSTGAGRSPGGYLCLRVADHDFALAFAAAIKAGFGVITTPRRDERGYWLTRTYNGHRRFDVLRDHHPTSHAGRAAWVRGLFDSEGNANLIARPAVGPQSWGRRVAFYSTNTTTLDLLTDHLSELDLPVRTRATVKPSRGHLGSRLVYEVQLRSSREHYARFADVVGSSIARKQRTLAQIVTSYGGALCAR